MDIPKTITEFFRFKNEHDHTGMASLFSEDAVVMDGGEGLEMRGSDEIEKWIQKSISGLNLKTEIGGCIETNGEWIINTIVSGDFKASPARFEYIIQVGDDEIQSLRVEFRGSLK